MTGWNFSVKILLRKGVLIKGRLNAIKMLCEGLS